MAARSSPQIGPRGAHPSRSPCHGRPGRRAKLGHLVSAPSTWSTASKPSSRPERIMPTLLVIDDEESVRYSFQRVFAGNGVTVFTARTAAEGLEAVRAVKTVTPFPAKTR